MVSMISVLTGSEVEEMQEMVEPGCPRRRVSWLAGVVFLASVAIIATVLGLEQHGYTPCELCLVERKPFYLAIPLALATFLAARFGRLGLVPVGFGLLALCFATACGIGIYHAGVEQHLWAGPSGCTGNLQAGGQIDDFLKQLQTVKVVRCDAPALLLFGLSLAAWNAIVSVALLALCFLGFWAGIRSPRERMRYQTT